MSTYVIGDIHGCFAEFKSLLDKVDFSCSQDRLILLGDVIDRGPSSDDVVEWIVDNRECIDFVLGNHEYMMLAATMDADDMVVNPWSDWVKNSGEFTADQLLSLERWQRRAFFDIVENAHKHIEVTVGDKTYSMVHAGYKGPFTEGWLERQDSETMLWARLEWLSNPQRTPLHTVFGHTPVEHIWYYNKFGESSVNGYMPAAPMNNFLPSTCSDDGKILTWNNRTAIDCGCFCGGSLCALRLDDFKAFYVSAFEDTIRMYVDYAGQFPIEDWEKVMKTWKEDSVDKEVILLLWEKFHTKLPELDDMPTCAELVANRKIKQLSEYPLII